MGVPPAVLANCGIIYGVATSQTRKTNSISVKPGRILLFYGSDHQLVARGSSPARNWIPE